MSDRKPQPLFTLHEDAGLTVFNKPSGLSTLADRQDTDNVWSQLQTHLKKPYLVHRLDKGTSGVLLVARTAASQKRLTQAFAAREVDKYYVCWVTGRFPYGRTLHIDLPLCRGRKSRYRVAAPRELIQRQNDTYNVQPDREHVDALTHVRCMATTEHHSLLMAKPVTGRTHQLRVHLSWIGFPIVGDHLYGKPKDTRQQHQRLLLHCHRLAVPSWGSFRAPLPANFNPQN